MNYENDYNIKTIPYKSFNISGFENGINTDKDQNLLPINCGTLSYNFDYSNGALRDGMGVGRLGFKTSISSREEFTFLDTVPDGSYYTGIWYLRSWSTDLDMYLDYVVLQTHLGNFYYVYIDGSIPQYFKIENMNFTETPTVVECNIRGKEALIFVSNTDVFVFQGYLTVKSNLAPKISSICSYNNKLYVTNVGEKGSKIDCYTIDDYTLEFNDTQKSIDINDQFGKINKIISYAGYLYAIRDFNIAKIILDDVNDYTVSQLLVNNGRIYENTVCLCGDKIVYLASDGVYIFNGSSTKKIELPISNLLLNVDNSYATAGYLDGNYYLACYLNFNDDSLVGEESAKKFTYNNALVRLNLKTLDISILRGYEITNLSFINYRLKSEICLIANRKDGTTTVGVIDDSGKFLDSNLEKLWCSPVSDFGYPDRLKCLKEITLETSKDIVVEIVTENSSRKVNLKGKKSYQKIKPYITAKQIGINIHSKETGNYISNIKFTVGIL